jgi:hypothetical protein
MASNWHNISQEDEQSLRHIADILHLFHFRNKNQHRHSSWWRSFSMFRQQLNRLLEDIFLLTDAPATHLARARKKAQNLKNRTRIQQRLTFWQSVLLTKWWHVFSQLVADGRFAVLGVVLLASLAQVCAINGLTADLEQLGQAEVEKVLEEFAKEEWGLGQHFTELEKEDEDLGHVVDREDLSQPQQASISDCGEKAAERKEIAKSTSIIRTKYSLTSQPTATREKRRKRRDAIDDLFNVLL